MSLHYPKTKLVPTTVPNDNSCIPDQQALAEPKTKTPQLDLRSPTADPKKFVTNGLHLYIYIYMELYFLLKINFFPFFVKRVLQFPKLTKNTMKNFCSVVF